VPLLRSPADPWLTVVRRVLVGVVATPFALAITMTLVDSYRRRGKKRAVSFPTAAPTTVSVGEGEVTTYTFGSDLYDDMIAAIDGAQRQILFETYIWKGDEVGQRFKTALGDAADRGVEVYCIYDSFANLVVSPRFKRFPASM
jgi:cardiolipin synthase